MKIDESNVHYLEVNMARPSLHTTVFNPFRAIVGLFPIYLLLSDISDTQKLNSFPQNSAFGYLNLSIKVTSESERQI